jgi:hypothetical protein
MTATSKDFRLATVGAESLTSAVAGSSLDHEIIGPAGRQLEAR